MAFLLAQHRDTDPRPCTTIPNGALPGTASPMRTPHAPAQCRRAPRPRHPLATLHIPFPPPCRALRALPSRSLALTHTALPQPWETRPCDSTALPRIAPPLLRTVQPLTTDPPPTLPSQPPALPYPSPWSVAVPFPATAPCSPAVPTHRCPEQSPRSRFPIPCPLPAARLSFSSAQQNLPVDPRPTNHRHRHRPLATTAGPASRRPLATGSSAVDPRRSVRSAC